MNQIIINQLPKGVREALKVDVRKELGKMTGREDYICSYSIGIKLMKLGITKHVDIHKDELQELFKAL